MPTCPSHPDVALEQKKKGWFWDECGAIVAPLDAAAATSPPPPADDLSALPFPVAFPLAWARDASRPPGQRVENAIFAAYQALRVTGLLLLGDYFKGDSASQLVANAVTGLRRPTWQDWSTLCDALVKFYEGRDVSAQPDPESAFPSLLAGWTAAKPANEQVQKIRNLRAHHRGAVTDETSDARDLANVLPHVEAMIAKLFPAGAFTLCRRGQGNTALRLHGSHHDSDGPRFAAEPVPEFVQDALRESTVVALSGGKAIPLHPLFVAADPETQAQPMGGGGLVESLEMLNGIDEKRVSLLGIRDFREAKDLAQHLAESLKRKQIDFGLDRKGATPWALSDWAAMTARAALDELEGRKYFPECYVEREGVDGRVDAALATPGKALLLLGEAGSGKSSLLSRLVDRLLREREATDDEPRKKSKKRSASDLIEHGGRGDVVLYLSGRPAFALDAGMAGAQLLCEAVCRRAGIRPGAFKDLEDLAVRLDEARSRDTQVGRRVWIVLDALNEADRFSDILRALDAFLPCLARYPWLRVVTSMRSGAYRSLERAHLDAGLHGSEVFANASFLHAFAEEPQGEEEGETHPFLDVRPFRIDDEGPRAYRLRQERRPDRSCRAPWERLDRKLQRLLLSPLHLQVFHETFAGKELPAGTLDEEALLEAYLDRLAADLPMLREKLPLIGSILYDLRTPELPAEVADRWVADFRAREGAAGATAKLDPVEEIVAAGLLMRAPARWVNGKLEGGGFQFRSQRLCEATLARGLRQSIAPRSAPTAEELAAWERQGLGPNPGKGNFSELLEVVEGFAARAGVDGAPERLLLLLDVEPAPVASPPLEAAIVAEARARPEGPWPTADGLAGSACSERRRATTFVEAAHEAVHTLKNSGGVPAALHVLEVAVPIARAVPPVLAVVPAADLLRKAAALFEACGRVAQARIAIDEALGLMRGALAEAPADLDRLRALSRCCQIAGRIAGEEGDSSGEQAAYEEELDIDRRRLAARPDDLEVAFDLSVTLTDTASLAEENGEHDKAGEMLRESVEIARRLILVDAGDRSFKMRLAGSARRLARWEEDRGSRERAEELFGESVRLYRDVSADEPGDIDVKSRLARALRGHASFLMDTGRPELALPLAREALDRAWDVARADRDTVAHRKGPAHSMKDLAEVQFALGLVKEARTTLEERVEFSRGFAKDMPDEESGLDMALMDLGALFVLAGRMREALPVVQEARGLREAQVRRKPNSRSAAADLEESSVLEALVGGRWASDDREATLARIRDHATDRTRSLVVQALERLADPRT